MSNRNQKHSNPLGERIRLKRDSTDQSNGQTLISRRGFLYGAIGAGALVAVGVGATISSSMPAVGEPDVSHLDVPENALTTLNELEVIDDYEDAVRLLGTFELPYGTLIWVNDDDLAACLLPTESGSPLAQIGLLSLGSGTLNTVRQKAVGADERYEIYDVRTTSKGMKIVSTQPPSALTAHILSPRHGTVRQKSGTRKPARALTRFPISPD